MSTEIELNIHTEHSPRESVIAAFPGPGMAAVSTNHYIIDQLDLMADGHIHVTGVPPITPYDRGQPYHPIRIFSGADLPVTFLTSELPIPLQMAEPFGRSLLEWIGSHDVSEVAVLTAIPFLPEDQDLYYVASDDYVSERLMNDEAVPLEGGFLTGINASLIGRAMESTFRVGVLATSVNPHRPLDADAALRLVDGLTRVYDVTVDTSELKEFARQSREHYEQLVAQFQAQAEGEARSNLREDYGFM